MQDGPNGVLVVDKPAGPTSHDIVDRARRALHTRRVGHTGTLDPFATGVLVLCVGQLGYLAVPGFGPVRHLADRFGGHQHRGALRVGHWKRLDVELDGQPEIVQRAAGGVSLSVGDLER